MEAQQTNYSVFNLVFWTVLKNLFNTQFITIPTSSDKFIGNATKCHQNGSDLLCLYLVKPYYVLVQIILLTTQLKIHTC